MSDEDVGFNRYALADEGMTRDLAAVADLCALLDFDKRPDPRLVANLAAIQIYERVNLHVATELDIREMRFVSADWSLTGHSLRMRKIPGFLAREGR